MITMSTIKVEVNIKLSFNLTLFQDEALRRDLSAATEDAIFEAVDAFLSDANITQPYTVGVKTK